LEEEYPENPLARGSLPTEDRAVDIEIPDSKFPSFA
jgi:hypothetical protein